jgi:hypothetical protein
MLQGRLDTVPFPFIGTDVPEGHQGQSVEGMSHGSVISKLRTGFHRRRLPWSFNADHQPVGGKFDAREDALVRGCLLASYITFDISPELALGQPAPASSVPAATVDRVRARVARTGLRIEAAEFDRLLGQVWPSMLKMKRRDDKYRAARQAAFTTEQGRRYLRELSIDELPGLTAPATTAVMLALCEALDMPVNFVAPAFGFQKNTPYPDNEALRAMTEAQWRVCRSFGVGLGFHSGSGKSAENYRVLGEVTGGRLEVARPVRVARAVRPGPVEGLAPVHGGHGGWRRIQRRPDGAADGPRLHRRLAGGGVPRRQGLRQSRGMQGRHRATARVTRPHVLLRV